MWTESIVVALCALVLAAALTGAIREFALSRSILDVPNERSSHSRPTPRGGGLAIALAASAGFVAEYLLGLLPADMLAALLGGGGAVAIVGAMDDRAPVAAPIRLAVHFAAAVWALLWLGGLPAISTGQLSLELGPFGYLLGVLTIVWTLNLFNFMDGIDGIAASEAVFVACGGAALVALGGYFSGSAAAGLVVGAASLGFLCWNWPPAKIFMGDVGSGFLGFVLGVVALGAVRDDAAAPLIWLLLGGAFLVDATVTLARRLARRERVYEAHRTHAYQWLARRWASHRRVTLIVIALDLVWLLPAAALATYYPRAAPWLILGALGPLVALAVVAGAGRPEVKSSTSSRG